MVRREGLAFENSNNTRQSIVRTVGIKPRKSSVHTAEKAARVQGEKKDKGKLAGSTCKEADFSVKLKNSQTVANGPQEAQKCAPKEENFETSTRGATTAKSVYSLYDAFSRPDEIQGQQSGLMRFFTRSAVPFCAPLGFGFCPPESYVPGHLEAAQWNRAAADWISPTTNSMVTDATPFDRVEYEKDCRESDRNFKSLTLNHGKDSSSNMSSIENQDLSKGGERSNCTSESSEEEFGNNFLSRLIGEGSESSESPEKNPTLENPLLKEEIASIAIFGNDDLPDDITIEADSIHFSGWDGTRSHYVAMVKENALCERTEKIDTPKLGRRGSASAKVNAAKLSLLSPDSHPLKTSSTTLIAHRNGPPLGESHSYFRAPKNQSANPTSPIMHFVGRKVTADAKSTSRVVVELDKNVSETRHVQAVPFSSCMYSSLCNFFLGYTGDLNQDNKNGSTTGKKVDLRAKDDQSFPLVLPMGDAESQIILNFLASSSSGSNQELSTPKEQQKGGETVVTAANGPQLLESAAEEKRPSKTLAHIETPRSSSSHHVSAQTKSSMHRRTNGVVSVFFSPENTYTLEVEKEGQIFLHALSAQQNHTTGKQRSTERTARSLSPVSPRHLQHQDGLKQGWRLKAGTTPDVMRRIPIVTCESQEIDMSPMMPDDYSPAITYQRVFNGPGAGEYVRRTMQRASRKKHISKKERPLAQADQHAVGPSGYSDGDKMKHTMRYLRHPRDSVNINLLDDLNKDAKDSPQRKSTTKDKRQITGFNASGDSDELMSSYLPMCSRQAQWRSFNGRNGRPARRVLEGWIALSISSTKTFKRVDRSCIKYVIVFDNSPTIYIFNSPGDDSAENEISILGANVGVQSITVSKKLGHCVSIQNNKSMNSICSLVPVSLDSECFEEGDRMDLVTSAEKFRNVFNATGLPRTARRRRSSDSAKAQRQKQWGDPHCLSEFASLGQHSACLHILFCINSVVYKFAKSSLICKANNAVQCGRDNGEVLLKVLLN